MKQTPPTALKLAIVAAGITQRDLARRLDIKESTFSRIVNGGLHASDATRAAIAQALDVPEADLWTTTGPLVGHNTPRYTIERLGARAQHELNTRPLGSKAA